MLLPAIIKNMILCHGRFMTALKYGRKFYSHAKMIKEIKTYLLNVKKTAAWN